MSRAGLLLAALVLLLALTGVAVWLGHAGPARRLRERVVAQQAQAPQAAVARLPSIRMVSDQRNPGLARVLRLLRCNPEIPQVMHWAVVLGIAGLVGLFACWMARGWVSGAAGALAGLAAGIFAARALFGWQHNRYAHAVFLQMPDALGLMVRAIRAGLPMAEALRGIAREMASPTREEFARIVGDMAIGRPVDAALMKLHERTGLTEYAFLAVTLGLQAQTGGSLAETLDNLADMVRKRVALAKRAEALAGEAKMQAGLLVALPFVAALAMSMVQPFYIAAFTQNPTGQKMALFGLGMMALGLLTIRWLIKQAGRD
jgi:tight adherence protein B